MPDGRVDSLLKGGHGVTHQTGHGVTHFSRIPRSVLFDEALNCFDKTVYCALAWQCWQGRTSAVGTRTIASKLGISRNQVKASLSRLIELGHLQAAGKVRNRNAYILTSPVFAQKQGRETIIRSAPGGVPRMVSIAREDVA